MGDDRLPARDRPATSVISKAPRRSISYRPEEPPSVFDQYVVNSATIFRSSRCSRANRFARYALPGREIPTRRKMSSSRYEVISMPAKWVTAVTLR